MTTIAQLVKAAKSEFIPKVEALGLTHLGKLNFVNEVNGVHQLIIPDLSYSENLKFIVTCFVAEYDPKYMDKFPSKVPLTSGGKLGENLFAGTFWDVESLEGIESIFEDILENIVKHAIPWFETVKSRSDYVEALYPHLRERLEEQGKLDLVLNGVS